MKKKIIPIIIFIILIIVIYFIGIAPKNKTKVIKDSNIAIYLDKDLSIKKDEVYKDGKLKDMKEIEEKVNKKLLFYDYQKFFNSQELYNKLDKEATNMMNAFDGTWSNALAFMTASSTKEEYIEKKKGQELEKKLAEDYYISTLKDNELKDYFTTKSGIINVSTIYIPKNFLSENFDVDPATTELAERVYNDIKNSENIINKMEEYKRIYPSDITEIKTTDIVMDPNVKEPIMELEDNSLCKEVLEDSAGYYIIYRINLNHKEKYDKDEVINELINNNVLDKEYDYHERSFDYLRNKYNISINDKKLKKEFTKYIEEKIKEEI